MKQLKTQLTKLGLLTVCSIALGLVSCAPKEPESESPDTSNANESTQNPTDSIGASNRPPKENESDRVPPEEDPLNPEVAKPDNDNDDVETDENGNEKPDMNKLIELSLNNADINNVIQWLAENANKSVVKDPNVNCRLTIVNPNKIKLSEALDLIYSALKLEGYLAIERGDVQLFIVPRDKAGSIQVEVASDDSSADSRNRVIKTYDLRYADPSDLAEKIKSVISEDANVEVLANKLVVTDYGDRITFLDQLIANLDVERSGEFDIRVIRIKNVDAEDLADEIEPIYERWDREFETDVEVVANQRSNSLIVLSNKDTFDMIQSLVENLDVSDAQQTIMDTILLENADAEEVAQQLTDLFENDSNSRNRYSYYNYRSSGGDEAKVNFVANRRQNSIIVQCPPATLPEVEKIVRQLDARITDSSLAPRIFRLKFVSAYDIELVLNEIFAQEDESRDYFGFYSFYDDRGGSSGGAGRLAGKVSIVSETYSNSVIVTSNSAENLEAVHQVIQQLDVPSSAGETTLRVPLNFAEAINVANQLNILFATAGAPPMQQPNNQGPNQNNQQGGQQGQQGNQFRQGFVLEPDEEDRVYYPWLGGQAQQGGGFGGRFGASSTTTTRPVSDLVGRVRVVPDSRTNSLLVTSNMNYFPEVIKLVNDLDLPTPQVVIQAKIVEVNSDLRDRLGVRWSPNGDQVFEADDLDTSLLGSGLGNYRDVVTGSELANALTTGVLSANVDLDVLIQFLKKTTDAKILATPQINVEDNELGRLFVGAQVPFITQSSFVLQAGGRNDTFDYRDVGIILEVTPKINNESQVALSVRVESSSIREGETLFGGFIFDTRNFQTDLTASNDETLVLGGILQSEDREIQRKVPLLGDIPGVGWAFKKRDTVTREVELMVFLKPRVTRSPEDVRRLMLNLQNESPNVTRWTRDLDERQRLSDEFSEEWNDLSPVEEPDSLLPKPKESEASEPSNDAIDRPTTPSRPKPTEAPKAVDPNEDTTTEPNKLDSADPIPNLQKSTTEWNDGRDTDVQEKLRRALKSQDDHAPVALPVVEAPETKDAEG